MRQRNRKCMHITGMQQLTVKTPVYCNYHLFIPHLHNSTPYLYTRQDQIWLLFFSPHFFWLSSFSFPSFQRLYHRSPQYPNAGPAYCPLQLVHHLFRERLDHQVSRAVIVFCNCTTSNPVASAFCWTALVLWPLSQLTPLLPFSSLVFVTFELTPLIVPVCLFCYIYIYIYTPESIYFSFTDTSGAMLIVTFSENEVFILCFAIFSFFSRVLDIL